MEKLVLPLLPRRRPLSVRLIEGPLTCSLSPPPQEQFLQSSQNLTKSLLTSLQEGGSSGSRVNFFSPIGLSGPISPYGWEHY